MRDRTNYMCGSVPWDVENKFGESKLQDREIISVILATADAYLNAEVWNLKIAQMSTVILLSTSSSQKLCQKTQSTRSRHHRDLAPAHPEHSNRQDRANCKGSKLSLW